MPTWTGTVEDAKGLRTYETPEGTGYAIWKQDKRLAAAGLPLRASITLGVLTPGEAKKKLAAFEDDPVGFVKKRQLPEPAKAPEPSPASAKAILIDADSVKKCRDNLLKEGRVKRYVENVGYYLAQWGADLAGRDLRTVTTQELLQVLASFPKPGKDRKGRDIVMGEARRHRVSAIKTFTAYLRGLGVLKAAEDPTVELELPSAEPEKAKRARLKKKAKGYKIADVERLYSALTPWKSSRPGWETKSPDVQSVRDVVLIHCKTGMHATEIERVAEGVGDLVELEGQGEIAATIEFVHKTGVHKQSIDRQTVDAIKRLRARGAAPAESYIKKCIKRAVESLGKDPDPDKDGIRLGELRHSFVTWLRERGELVKPKDGGLPLEEIAAAIGHKSTRMTRTRYDNAAVPAMVKVPIKLHHPEDPLPLIVTKRSG